MSRRKKRLDLFEDNSFFSNEFKGTKEFISGRIAAGQIKQCPTCPLFIGASWKMCGSCEEEQKMVVITEANREIKAKISQLHAPTVAKHS